MIVQTAGPTETDRRSDPSEVIYLIGFSPAATQGTLDRIADALPMVQKVKHRNLDCWYVPVDRSQFEGELGEQNLANLEWLGPKVLAHQVAVETLSRELLFFPAHFGALFSSIERLADSAQTNWRMLNEYFADVAKHVEWGIKCLVNWPLAVESFQHEKQTQSGTGGAGLNYLLKKKMIRDRDQAVRDWIETMIAEVRLSIGEIAIRHRTLQTGTGRREGDWECVHNWALLVDREHGARMEEWIRERHPGLIRETSMIRLQLTGPWPLYSFLPTLADLDSDIATD